METRLRTGERLGSECLMGAELQSGKTEKFWRQGWGQLHNKARVRSAAELCTRKGSGGSFDVTCVLWQIRTNKLINERRLKKAPCDV